MSMHEGWGYPGKRGKVHYIRAGMPICYQRRRFRKLGWRHDGVLYQIPHRRWLNSDRLCKDCLFFVDEDNLPPALRGRRPEDEDAVASRQYRLARINKNS